MVEYQISESNQGDSWDFMALQVYGSEKLAFLIIQANPEYHHYVTLPAGLPIKFPQLIPAKLRSQSSPLPPWARG